MRAKSKLDFWPLKICPPSSLDNRLLIHSFDSIQEIYSKHMTSKTSLCSSNVKCLYKSVETDNHLPATPKYQEPTWTCSSEVTPMSPAPNFFRSVSTCLGLAGLVHIRAVISKRPMSTSLTVTDPEEDPQRLSGSAKPFLTFNARRLSWFKPKWLMSLKVTGTIGWLLVILLTSVSTVGKGLP